MLWVHKNGLQLGRLVPHGYVWQKLVKFVELWSSNSLVLEARLRTGRAIHVRLCHASLVFVCDC